MFVDSDGGKWAFRATGRRLRHFEERTGIRLYQRLGESLPEDIVDLDDVESAKSKIGVRTIVGIFTSVIGGVGDALGLLYACREWVGEDGAEPKKLGFDDFCDRFAAEKIGEATKEAVNVLLSCVMGMVSAAAVTARPGDEGAPSPLAGSGGATSSPSEE